MRRLLVLTTISLITLALTSCSGNSADQPVGKVPDKPAATAPTVIAANYQNSYGDYVFRIGGGTVWCTISSQPSFVICEHNEIDVAYKLPVAPESCQGAWGFQARLWSNQPSEGKIADWYCSSGLYSDPEGIFDLPKGSKIQVGAITCYAADVVARCDNESGQYFALGAEVYGFGN
jgi:hypothetical protein